MITPRLEMILRHVTGNAAADIGTDHGYIPIKLAEKGMKVIATDINEGPLGAAQKNAEKYGANISLRLGAGLEPLLPGEADCIIIAGMGGELIQNIISADLEIARHALLLLQPMNSQYELRNFLRENGFCIEYEDLAAEGHKIYNLFVVRSGEPNQYKKEIDLHLPPLLYGNSLFRMLVEKKRREFEKIYKGLSAGGDGTGAARIKLLLDDTIAIERSLENESF
ncbi:MAG: class I SAM-dependent methyltransferase [Clostridiales bacterium]|nr:class I SAM-dependent methyltransferase [Clostridiales bacterium]